jgi:hypothetical protein
MLSVGTLNQTATRKELELKQETKQHIAEQPGKKHSHTQKKEAKCAR